MTSEIHTRHIYGPIECILSANLPKPEATSQLFVIVSERIIYQIFTLKSE